MMTNLIETLARKSYEENARIRLIQAELMNTETELAVKFLTEQARLAWAALAATQDVARRMNCYEAVVRRELQIEAEAR